MIEAAAQVPHATANHASEPVPASGTDRRVAHPPQELAIPPWHALRLRSRFEFTVQDQFRAEGIPEFLPTFIERVRWKDRENSTTRTLFPGYIFARFENADAGQVLLTRGVVQILSIDQQPISIPDDEIDNLRRVVDSPVSVASCPYVAGVAVTVERGPFAGVTGVISRVKGATTLTIPVPILGRAVSVQIEACDVKPAVKEKKARLTS